MQPAGTEAACILSGESGPAHLPPREPHLVAQHPASRALTCVCEHLCFISIYSGHPLKRYVLTYLLLGFSHFGLLKGFIGILHFQVARETCILKYLKYLLSYSFCSKKSTLYVIVLKRTRLPKYFYILNVLWLSLPMTPWKLIILNN